MKKSCFLIILLVMISLVLAAAAEPPTEFDIPETGTEISGFVVRDVSDWDDYLTGVVKLEHIRTGSVLFWLANDNTNRSFTVSFHTPVYDDTGIAHVFEHATLGGSVRYPGANTFFEMSSKTSNTYLNASTSAYSTNYKMASISEDQLIQYIDFYMSGLTEPLAISNPNAMMREAFRYELNDRDEPISIQGVVYSEMLGALSKERMAYYNFMRTLWPGSYLSSISGGDPEHIPELTLEKIQAFHETYYHPSNATMVLTGNLDLPRILELLDTRYLSRYDHKDIRFEDPGYTPVVPGYHEKIYTYPTEEGTPTENGAIMYYAYPFDVTRADYNDLAFLDYAAYYLNDEASPFIQMTREQLPGASCSASVSWNPDRKMSLIFAASGLNESDKDKFRTICETSLAEVLRSGVNADVLDAILTNRRFSDLMELDDSSVYLSLGDEIISSQYIFGDPDAWKMTAEFNRSLDQLITVDNLNQAAKKYWSDLDTAVMAVTVPKPGLREEKDAALRRQLDDMKAAMSPEEVEALIQKTKDYHTFVEESNAILMPESLNALSVSSLPEEVSYKEAAETSLDGIRLITSEVDSPLTRIDLVTRSDVIPFEDLFAYLEFTHLMGQLGTDLYPRISLPSRLDRVSAGAGFLRTSIVEDKDTREYVVQARTSWYTLPDLLEESFALIEHILYHTDFSDYAFIRNDAAQQVASFTNSLSSSALSLGVYAAFSPFSGSSKLVNYLNGDAFVRYLDKVSKMTDAELDELTAKFETFRNLVLNRNGAVLSIMGNQENLLRSSALGYQLLGRFDSTPHESFDYTVMLPDSPRHTAIVTGGNIVYNIAAVDLEAAGFDRNDGGLQVIQEILNNKLLYPELRVKNSAYGGYCLKNDYLLGFYSYRDPKVAETYQVYASTADFLQDLSISESELEGYQISSYSQVNAPIGPLSTALRGIQDKINHQDTREESLRLIRDIKAFTPADIKKYISLFTCFGQEDAVRVTTGARSMIESCSDLFETINYDLLAFTTDENPSAGPTDEP